MNTRISERLILKPIHFNDLIFVHELHSLPEIDEFNLLGIPENLNVTEEIISKWIVNNNEENQQSFTYSIQLSTGQFIGVIGLNLGKPTYRNAEIWFKIHSKYWNKGYATEALKSILEFGFNELNLHRIEAGCAVRNLGSIKVLEKSGMLLEGRKRQLLPLKSGWSDNFGYAVLASDFKRK